MSRPAPPPSPQEVSRKLSVHSVVKPVKKPTVATSGTESDSDSAFSPEVIAPSPLSGISISGALIVGSSSQPPLSSIAERRSGSGEESEEDEEEEEGGWHAENKERASLDETVIKTGYLWKKGERRKTWKKRWFVLRPAHLAFYKTSAEYKLLRLLDLSEIHSCTPVMLKKHHNTFGLISPTRTFYLQAESGPEVQEWVKAINEARTALQATSTQNSATAPIPIPTSSSAAVRSSQQIAPLSASPSQSPHNHQTSSDSDDASPSGLHSYTTITPATAGDAVSPSKQPGVAVDASKVVLSGYLMKCGSRRHIWHNRWFVLTGEKLVYSRSHMDTKHHRQMPLAQILDALEYDLPPNRSHPSSITSPSTSPPQAASFASDDAEKKQGTHTFKIVTTKRTLLLCAPSEEEEIRWLSAIRALIARRSGAGVVPGDSAATLRMNALAPVAGVTAGSAGNMEGPSHGSGAGASTAGGGATPTGKRRDSIARRLSLSGTAAFTSSATAAPSATPQDPIMSGNL